MKPTLILLLTFFGFIVICSAQNVDKSKIKPVIVVGKVLSVADSTKVQQLFFEGIGFKYTENVEESTRKFLAVLEIDQANDAALYELANIYHDHGNEADAESLIRRAVTVKPDNIWYWTLLSDIYKKANNYKDAIPVFDQLISLSAQVEEYYYDKASALLNLKKTKEALAVYQEIENRFGTSNDLSLAQEQIFIQQGKPEKAVSELLKQIAKSPNEIRNYLFLSEIYTKNKEWDKSIDILLKAKLVAPENAMVRLSLADHYRSINQFDNSFIELKEAFKDQNLNVDEKVRIVLSFFPLFSDIKAKAYAEELSKIATDVHPDDPKVFAVYGDVLFQQQKYVQAADVYRTALKLNSQVYQIWEQLVRIDISLPDFKQAIIDGDQALEIFPNQAALYLYTGIAYSQTQKHDKAVTYLKNAANLETENNDILGQIYSSLGDSYNALKKFKESDIAYDKSIEYLPNNSFTLNNYAYYLSLRGEKLDKAETMSRRSNELVPNNASSQDTYAWILFKLKRFDEAKVWIEKAIANDKGNSGVQIEHYGDILYNIGEKQEAVNQWIKAKTAGVKSLNLDRKINEKKYIE
ncbi:MAG: tetratricopeptide repeat protein [Daejeonella sp.]|nr:tetratricopeptide repeat protein [Daejeonella sp.]